MLVKIFLNLIFITSLSLVQISFVNTLPFPFNELNLIIVALVFVLALSSSMQGVWLFLLVGFIFDMYSLFSIGFFTWLWPTIFLLTRFIFVNFFTNRSLYSFLFLNFFTIFFYFFISHFTIYFYRTLSGVGDLFLLKREFWISISAGVIVNSVAVLLLFYIFNFLSNRLRPVFIWKKH